MQKNSRGYILEEERFFHLYPMFCLGVRGVSEGDRQLIRRWTGSPEQDRYLQLDRKKSTSGIDWSI